MQKYEKNGKTAGGDLQNNPDIADIPDKQAKAKANERSRTKKSVAPLQLKPEKPKHLYLSNLQELLSDVIAI